MAWVFGGLLLVVIVGIVYVIGIYNGLVRLRNEKDNAWSQIDVQLKRRHDLIPNLVETVKGYAKHERGTLERVIQGPQPGGGGARAGGGRAGRGRCWARHWANCLRCPRPTPT